MEETTRPDKPDCEQPRPDWLKDIQEVFDYARAHIMTLSPHLDNSVISHTLDQIKRVHDVACLSEGALLCSYCEEPTASQMLQSDEHGEPFCPWCLPDVEGDSQ